jgi:hypothetical protein
MMLRYCGAALLALVFLAPDGVRSEPLVVIPVQRDQVLRAAYCQEVVTYEATLLANHIRTLPPEARSDPRVIAIWKAQRDNVERLTLYLSPDNTQGVSPGDQLSAISRAQADIAQTGQLPACGTPGTAAFKACDDGLLATYPALVRVRSCNDLSWLPY